MPSGPLLVPNLLPRPSGAALLISYRFPSRFLCGGSIWVGVDAPTEIFDNGGSVCYVGCGEVDDLGVIYCVVAYV